MSEDALFLRDVWKIYKTATEEIPVLKGINLTVRQGELAIIMGPSGSGKSTLLSIAGGLENPSRGNVIVGGVDITNLSEDELTKIRARKIGFVFQSFNLIRNLTALENVMMPLIFTGIYSWKQAREIAQKMLEIVGLKGHEEKFPRQLSGGQQQRVAIARALAPSPDIILMDEPTGSLDVDSASRVLSLVKWLNEAFGQTIVVVTHNPEIAELASRTFYIRGGQIFEQPPTATLTEKQIELIKHLFKKSKPMRVFTVTDTQLKISQDIGISRQALNIHLRKLKELGYIRTGRGFIDLTENVLPIIGKQRGDAFIFVKLDPPKRLPAYEAIKELPVDKIYRVTGDIDVILQVSQPMLDEVLDKINSIDGVRETKTYVVIETLK